MTAKLEAAAAILESRGWKFNGRWWQEPCDEAGNSAFEIADTMADLLEAHLQVHAEHAEKRGDTYSRAVADHLAPVLSSWQKVCSKAKH